MTESLSMIITMISFLLPIQKTRTFIRHQKLPLVVFSLSARQIRRHILQLHFSENDGVHLFDKNSSYRHKVLFNERPLHNGHSSCDNCVMKGK